MGRVCVRAGCGRAIKANQIFCGKDCRNADKREKLAAKRARAATCGRCPTCGQARKNR